MTKTYDEIESAAYIANDQTTLTALAFANEAHAEAGEQEFQDAVTERCGEELVRLAGLFRQIDDLLEAALGHGVQDALATIRQAQTIARNNG